MINALKSDFYRQKQADRADKLGRAAVLILFFLVILSGLFNNLKKYEKL